jgi:type IV pilus assembly protein PilX
LITGLVALLLLTILGVAGLQVSTMEERMAANARRRDIAFHAADSALRAGETWLRSTTPAQLRALTFACADSNGLYLGNCGGGKPLWESLEAGNAWTDSSRARLVVDWPSTATEVKPSYIVEQVQRGGVLNDNLEIPRSQPDAVMYRITARGAGPGQTPDAYSIVQSTFKKPD